MKSSAVLREIVPILEGLFMEVQDSVMLMSNLSICKYVICNVLGVGEEEAVLCVTMLPNTCITYVHTS